jgi:hypothetical protein
VAVRWTRWRRRERNESDTDTVDAAACRLSLVSLWSVNDDAAVADTGRDDATPWDATIDAAVWSLNTSASH